MSYVSCAYLRSLTLTASDVKSAISPCGMCRQFIREFCALNMPILLVPADHGAREVTADGDGVVERTLGELLPDSFGPEHLELPRS
jgi:cytidine deaminase